MSDTIDPQLLSMIFADASANAAGELLRKLTFPGEGFGCYTQYEIRDDAREWDAEERAGFWRYLGYEYDPEEGFDEAEDLASMGRGCTFEFGPYTVDCCWYWDGDGTLCYVVWSDGQRTGDPVRAISNNDCKKDYNWDDLQLPGTANGRVTGESAARELLEGLELAELYDRRASRLTAGSEARPDNA